MIGCACLPGRFKLIAPLGVKPKPRDFGIVLPQFLTDIHGGTDVILFPLVF
jgi:hypothetical protein